MTSALLLAGCASTEVARFSAAAGQQTVIRQGRSAVVSEQSQTTMIVAPPSRQIPSNGRPAYVAAIYNSSPAPITFHYSDISAVFVGPSSAQPLRVWTIDDLQREARNQAILGAILIGAVTLGAGAVMANNPPYYSPLANSIAAASLGASGGAAMGDILTTGELAVTQLENQVLQDHTIFPGEWYGGTFQFDRGPRLEASDPDRTYRITFRVGNDVHQFTVDQVPTGQ